MSTTLPLDAIRLDGSTHLPGSLDNSALQEYAGALADRGVEPPGRPPRVMVGAPVIFYTFGLASHPLPSLVAKLKELDGMLVDIRWSSSLLGILRGTLGERYRHVRALANTGGQVHLDRIFDLTGGIREVEQLAVDAVRNETGPLVLMCTCADYQTCHRSFVADVLRERGHVVEELVLARDATNTHASPLPEGYVAPESGPEPRTVTP